MYSIRFGHQEHRTGHQIDGVADQSPANQAMHRSNRNPTADAEQPQIEEHDRADEQREADEVQALGHRPHPDAMHQTTNAGRASEHPHEPDLEISHRSRPVRQQSRIGVRQAAAGRDRAEPADERRRRQSTE